MTAKLFAIVYILYALFSFIGCLTVSFTSLAWIVYFLIIAPFYLLCITYVVVAVWSNCNSTIWLRRSILYVVFLFQGLMVLSSPGSCYGWSQGQLCYSLVQTLFVDTVSHEDIRTLATQVPHWSIVESAFPVMIGLYILAMALFLGLLRFNADYRDR
jgi:hypothetical protein